MLFSIVFEKLIKKVSSHHLNSKTNSLVFLLKAYCRWPAADGKDEYGRFDALSLKTTKNCYA